MKYLISSFVILLLASCGLKKDLKLPSNNEIKQLSKNGNKIAD